MTSKKSENKERSYELGGMAIPWRLFSSGDGYKYGYNGMERDDIVLQDLYTDSSGHTTAEP